MGNWRFGVEYSDSLFCVVLFYETLFPMPKVNSSGVAMINELYIECSTCLGKIYFNLWSNPITLEILVPIALRCAFQFRLESIMSPKKLNSVTCSICILSMLNNRCGTLF